MIRKSIARTYWRFSRWTLVNEPQPDFPRIIVGAPHTSNWDFVFMLAICWRSNVAMRWLGKHTLFTGWRGPLMRGLGGISVDRSKPGSIITQVLAEQHNRSISIVITPEGTRRATRRWKSGFYRLALESGLPVTLAFVDRNTMTTGLGPTITLSGEPVTDMNTIRAYYADKAGFHPEKTNVPELSIEGRQSPRDREH